MPADLQQTLAQNLSQAPYSPFAYMKSPSFFKNVPGNNLEIADIQEFSQVEGGIEEMIAQLEKMGGQRDLIKKVRQTC